MQIHKLRELIEFDDKRFSPRVLMNRPGYRLVLLNLRRGQSIPEHATKEMVTVYAISGHITFYEAQSPFELRAGEVLFIEGGVPHAVQAHEDSALLVVAAGESIPAANPELDLRAVPHMHPIPLYRQMDAMRPGQAVWSYLDRGPDVFRIR
ncbi:MAG: cupin domain-containing protein, partial [Candidatus Sulfotelmatobacter sp.]